MGSLNSLQSFRTDFRGSFCLSAVIHLMAAMVHFSSLGLQSKQPSSHFQPLGAYLRLSNMPTNWQIVVMGIFQRGGGLPSIGIWSPPWLLQLPPKTRQMLYKMNPPPPDQL
jgi:hypothetical protein